jgi:cytochrome c oxidase subunit 4
MSDKIVPGRTYLIVCVGVLVLTGATVALAHVDLRGWNTLIALVVAAIQAVLIGQYLMHLRWSPPVIRLVALAGVLWLAILLAGTLDDLLTRGWLPVPGK